MTNDQLASLEDALRRAFEAGDGKDHLRLVDSALVGVLREIHEGRAEAAMMREHVAKRAAAVDDRLQRIEAAVGDMGDIVELAQTARLIVGWCSRRAANLRAAVVWLTPLVVFIAAAAAARETLAAWWAEFFSGRR